MINVHLVDISLGGGDIVIVIAGISGFSDFLWISVVATSV